MRTMNRPLLAALALLPLAGCDGDAHAATRTYSVTDVSRLRVAGPFDVHVHVGASSSVRATGPQEAIDRLSVEQNEETLVIKPLSGGWGGWPMGFHGNLVVDVTMPSLDQAIVTGSGGTTIDRVKGDKATLVLSGSGSLKADGIQVTQLDATLTGSGDLVLAGRAVAAKAVLTGPGGLKASALLADDAQVSVTGSGDLSIGAKHTAKGSLAGSGDLTIVGPATCAIGRTGSGDVHCGHKAAE
jgi:hypothetical protein